VDLPSYESTLHAKPKKVIFRHISDPRFPRDIATEINILSKLPPYPNIVPIDRVLLEEMTGVGVVGLTISFVPGRQCLIQLVAGSSS
jgi:hypothetical protein